MIKVISINITYHRATAILHDTYFSIRKFISKGGVMLFAVGCCEFRFYSIFIMDISVCFSEKVKIYMLYQFYM
jgi:hypothetical protein